MNNKQKKIKQIADTQECIIAFFDILGFTEMVHTQKCFSSKEKCDIPRKNQETMAALVRLWSFIESLAETNQIIPFLFSDCGFLLFPIKKDDNRYEKFIICIEILTQLLDAYLNENFFLRGTVTHGPVICKNNLLLGADVARAAKWESQCPGPFLFFHSIDIQKIVSINTDFILPAELKMIFLNNNKGVSQGHIIFPSDKRKYINEIYDRGFYYAQLGKSEWASFWLGTYNFLISNYYEFKKFKSGEVHE